MDKVVVDIKKWDWKMWALVGFGGVAVIAAGAFIVQSKHAALGRQVHRNVTKFLVDNGARIEGGVISGGMVSIPMKTNIAVNSTVVSLLNMFADQSGGRPPLNPAVSSDEPVITGRHNPGTSSPSMQQQQQSQVEVGPSQAQQTPMPSPRSGKRASMTATPRNPSDSPDDGGFASRESKKGGQDTSYNPMEFVPKGNRPPENADLFADDARSSGAGPDFDSQ